MAHSASMLEGLPLEIHHNVLLHVSSPDDVYATIRASPIALNAFLTGRLRILVTVLERSLAPGMFGLMLAILDVGKYEDFRYKPSAWEAITIGDDECKMKTRNEAWMSYMRFFYRRSYTGNTKPLHSSKPLAVQKPPPRLRGFKALAEALIQLYGVTKRQINAFQAFSLGLAENAILDPLSDASGLRHASTNGEWPALNPSERLRLQRAFLRYELASRLTGLSSMTAMADETWNKRLSFWRPGGYVEDFWTNPFDHRNPSMKTFPDDEIEEIMSVKTFIQDTYETIYYSICEDLFRKVKSQAVPAQVGASKSVKRAREWLEDTMGEHIEFMSPSAGQVRASIDTLSRLGLCFLQKGPRTGALPPLGSWKTKPAGGGHGLASWGELMYYTAEKPDMLSVKVATAPELDAYLAEDDFKGIMAANYSLPMPIGYDEDGTFEYTTKRRFLAQAKAVINDPNAEFPTLGTVCPGAQLDFTFLDI